MVPIEWPRTFNKPICSLSSSDKCEYPRMATLPEVSIRGVAPRVRTQDTLVLFYGRRPREPAFRERGSLLFKGLFQLKPFSPGAEQWVTSKRRGAADSGVRRIGLHRRQPAFTPHRWLGRRGCIPPRLPAGLRDGAEGGRGGYLSPRPREMEVGGLSLAFQGVAQEKGRAAAREGFVRNRRRGLTAPLIQKVSGGCASRPGGRNACSTSSTASMKCQMFS